MSSLTDLVWLFISTLTGFNITFCQICDTFLRLDSVISFYTTLTDVTGYAMTSHMNSFIVFCLFGMMWVTGLIIMMKAKAYTQTNVSQMESRMSSDCARSDCSILVCHKMSRFDVSIMLLSVDYFILVGLYILLISTFNVTQISLIWQYFLPFFMWWKFLLLDLTFADEAIRE